jgi:hypothetical protein
MLHSSYYDDAIDKGNTKKTFFESSQKVLYKYLMSKERHKQS